MFTIKADGQSIFYPLIPHMKLLQPKLTLEMGKAGSLSFNIAPTHPFIDTLVPFKTNIIVEMDDVELFRGRVLQSTRGFNNTRSIYCEGNLAYLVDSVIKGQKFSGNTHTLFRNILSRHNARVEESKRFKEGMLTIENRDIIITGQSDETTDPTTGRIDYKQIAVNSIVDDWMTSYDYIENTLIEYCGGYLRTRQITVNGVTTLYLDLIADYEHDAVQEIVFGKNLLDLTEEASVDDIITVLVPLGDDNLTLEGLPDTNNVQVDGITGVEEGRFQKVGDELIDTVAVEQFGRIVKTHSFENVNTRSTLLENGLRFMLDHKNMPVTITVKAVDMSFVTPNAVPIRVGDRVRVKSIKHGLTDYLTCTKIEYDISNPANNTYTFGQPNQTLTQRYRKDKNKEQASRGGRGGGAAGAASEEAKEEAKEDVYNAWIDYDPAAGTVTLGTLYEKWLQGVNTIQTKTGIDMSSTPTGSSINIDTMYSEVQENNTFRSNISTWAGPALSSVTLQAAMTQQITEDLQDSQVASVVIAAQEGLGAYIMANTAGITTLGNRIANVEGSAVYQHGQVIDAVAGKFSIDEAGDLVINDGTGLKLTRDSTTYGIFDEGNLTAGIIVEKINDGSSKINANRVFINAGESGEVNIAAKVTNIDSNYTNLVQGTTMASELWASAFRATNATIAGVLTVNGTLQADGHNVVSRDIVMDNIEPVGATFFGAINSDVDLSHHHDLTITENQNGTITVTIGDTIYKSSGDNTKNFSIAATQTYINGVAATWTNASVNSSLPVTGSNPDTITAVVPDVIVGQFQTKNYKLSLSDWDGDDATVYLKDTFSGVSVASLPITGPGSGGASYIAGWAAAYGKVSVPTGQSNSNNITFEYPTATVDGAAGTTTYWLTADSSLTNDNAYAYLHAASTSGTVVARTSIKSLYTAGANSVTVTSATTGGWSSGTKTITLSSGQHSSSVSLVAADLTDWSISPKSDFYTSHKYTASFKVCGRSFSGDVDATSAFADGQAAGINSVTVTSATTGGWSSGTKTITLSSGQHSSSVSIVASDLTGWSVAQKSDFATSHKYTASFKVCGRSFSGDVDASTAYTAGNTAGVNSGKSTGWNAAAAATKVEWSGTSNQILKFTTPRSGSYGATDSQEIAYSLSDGGIDTAGATKVGNNVTMTLNNSLTDTTWNICFYVTFNGVSKLFCRRVRARWTGGVTPG